MHFQPCFKAFSSLPPSGSVTTAILALFRSTSLPPIPQDQSPMRFPPCFEAFSKCTSSLQDHHTLPVTPTPQAQSPMTVPSVFLPPSLRISHQCKFGLVSKCSLTEHCPYRTTTPSHSSGLETYAILSLFRSTSLPPTPQDQSPTAFSH